MRCWTQNRNSCVSAAPGGLESLWQQTVAIPNKEVSQEYVNAISTMDWHEVIGSVEASRKLLEALWAVDGDAVAVVIELK